MIMSRMIGECPSSQRANQLSQQTSITHPSAKITTPNHSAPNFFLQCSHGMWCVFVSFFGGNANNLKFKYLFRAHQVCLETPKSCFALLKVSTWKRRATAGTKFPARAKEPKTLKRGKLDRSRKGHLLPLLNAYYRWATYKVQFNFFSSNKARVHLHTL